MASIKDVAIKAEVSTATVSHVINGTRYVADKTKEKVYAAMKDLDYSPNMVARSLRSRKSNTIGLLVPLLAEDTSNFFFMSIANGIEQVLKENGYNLVLSNSNENADMEKDQIKVFNRQHIDGLVIAPVNGKEHRYEDQFNGEYPVVFIDRRPQGYKGDTILVNNRQGTKEAVEVLLNKGHEKIGFITGTLGITTSDERLEGYKESLAQHHIAFNKSYIKEGPATFQKGYQLAEELHKEGVTALFVANNVMTMGSVSYLQANDVKVPDQMAIIGYDDYDWMKIASPPLSVVRQPAFEMGKAAVEQLLKRIHGDTEGTNEVMLNSELVIRGSC
ncbi:LacI family transcriptional regulator [Halobacillus andaensis]|uniref:LacI family transcriptional regulator n=1 Tax=Halobacillus andaensis TaxID=1176239 RepID=A0A917EX93_HALAA|nr:LacI family DNA-binding transcriptional regulator [Halobacillus andaensis]MBP2005273.1 LacI family transcriptional regulator [Halobacillus andaensis]GGF30209.1 LacI family transcriptional regulator [Halobacillus andaensis]